MILTLFTYNQLSCGDINCDGFKDLIVTAAWADGETNAADGTGEVYVIFGKATGWASSMQPSALNGNTGFVFYGTDGVDLTGVVTSAGDVNGDGCDDVAMNAFLADGVGNALSSSGEVYVVFGKASGWAASLKPSLLDGTNGFVVTGADAGGLTKQKVH